MYTSKQLNFRVAPRGFGSVLFYHVFFQTLKISALMLVDPFPPPSASRGHIKPFCAGIYGRSSTLCLPYFKDIMHYRVRQTVHPAQHMVSAVAVEKVVYVSLNTFWHFCFIRFLHTPASICLCACGPQICLIAFPTCWHVLKHVQWGQAPEAQHLLS